MPLAGGDEATLAVGEHGVVLGAQEVGDRVAVLGRVVGHDPVDARLEGVVAREPERVADVDDGAALPGRDEPELLGSRRPHLQAPLLGEEQRQRADVRVLLVADVEVLRRIRWDVVHHGYGAGGGAVVAVRVLEPLGPRETQSRGQR